MDLTMVVLLSLITAPASPAAPQPEPEPVAVVLAAEIVNYLPLLPLEVLPGGLGHIGRVAAHQVVFLGIRDAVCLAVYPGGVELLGADALEVGGIVGGYVDRATEILGAGEEDLDPLQVAGVDLVLEQ